MQQNVTTLLLGGGYTLSNVAKTLAPDSFVITTRSSDKLQAFRKAGYQAEILDIRDPESIAKFFKNYPLLNTIVDSVPPELKGFDLSALHHSLTGVNHIASRLPKSVMRIIYLSTTGVFGVEDGSWVDEATPAAPKHLRALARLESEKIYQSSGPEFTAIRIAAIYGPGRGIGLSLKSRQYKLIEDGKRWSNRIHVDDLSNAISLAIKKDFSQPLPKIICASDDRPSLSLEVVKHYCSKFELPFPEAVSLAEAEAKGMHSLLSNQRIRNTLLKESLVGKLRYPSYIEGAGAEF